MQKFKVFLLLCLAIVFGNSLRASDTGTTSIDQSEHQVIKNGDRLVTYTDYYISILALQLKALRGYASSKYENKPLKKQVNEVLSSIPLTISELMALKNQFEGEDMEEKDFKIAMLEIIDAGHENIIEIQKSVEQILEQPGVLKEEVVKNQADCNAASIRMEEECMKAMKKKMSCEFYKDIGGKVALDIAEKECQSAGLAALASCKYNPNTYQDISEYMIAAEILCSKKAEEK